MNKLKGLVKLNKAVSTELKPFGISKAKLSDDYSYIFADESVTYKILEDDLADKFFNDFIKERFGIDTTYYGSFVISLLHEVGHHKANDEIEGAIYDFCMSEKERIAEELAEVETEEKAKALEYQYFNLPDEIMATQWAVNWIKKNPKKMQKMNENMKKAVLEFAEKNGFFNED